MAQTSILQAQRIIYLTAGFINGELNFGEQQELAAWKNESLENRLLFDELVDEDNRLAAVKKMQQFDTEGGLLRLKLQMERKSNKRQKQVKIYWSAAAAVLIAAIGLFFTLFRPVQPRLLTAVVPNGKFITVTLPDSTKVWLNAGTTLQYPEQFKGATRSINLKEGEAYFEVVHSAKPFIVHAKGTDVNVLGTSFEVVAFTKEWDTRVTVNTGKVGVIQPAVQAEAAFLLPGDRAIINKATHEIKKVHIDPADVAAWRSDRLIFEDQPLAEVLQSLERRYNVHIQIKNERLLSERVTMRLNNQPLDNVLTAISFSNHFSFKKINDQLVIVK